MDPTAIIAIIGALGLWIDRIINGRKDSKEKKKLKKIMVLMRREHKREINELRKSHQECMKRDLEKDERLRALETENKTISYMEKVIRDGRDSDWKKLRIEFDGLRALYDPKKKKITHVSTKPPEAGETVGDK